MSPSRHGEEDFDLSETEMALIKRVRMIIILLGLIILINIALMFTFFSIYGVINVFVGLSSDLSQSLARKQIL